MSKDWLLVRMDAHGNTSCDPVRQDGPPTPEVLQTYANNGDLGVVLEVPHLVHIFWKTGRDNDRLWFWVHA